MEQKSGFFWHIHHYILVEWSDNIDYRVDYIKTNKSTEEIELRLRVMKPVKGKLPEAFVAASNAWNEAKYGESLLARHQARHALKKALNNNMTEIEALHKAECTDCPWNGYSIFDESHR